jgi:hypothetical protein
MAPPSGCLAVVGSVVCAAAVTRVAGSVVGTAGVAHVTGSVVGAAGVADVTGSIVGAAPMSDMARRIIGAVLRERDDGSCYGECKSGSDCCCQTGGLHVNLLVG